MQTTTTVRRRRDGAGSRRGDPRFGRGIGRRRFLTSVLPSIALTGWSILNARPAIAQFLDNRNALPSPASTKLFNEATARVLPAQGYASKVGLGDSVVKLVANGVIDRAKLEALYARSGGLPAELKGALDKPPAGPILLTAATANYYINLLWPLGLANYMFRNLTSPVNGSSLFNFASTGGWTLGRERNGGAYFNKLRIVALTQAQEALVTRVAENCYRPCCENSAFFQDCNHGSALLGMLALGASGDLGEDQLYREAVAFNSFWFPQTYIQAALYFKAVNNTDWANVDPRTVMGKGVSAASGSGVITAKVNELGLVPRQGGGAGCGVAVNREADEPVLVAQRPGCSGCGGCATCAA